jgi:hypothetical protein
MRQLTATETRQLKSLFRVYRRPTETAIWHGDECAALIELGLAESVPYDGGIRVTTITPAGVAYCEQNFPSVTRSRPLSGTIQEGS